MQSSLRDISWPTLVALAFAKLAIHVATSAGFGHFRDELYYLASTRHLAWGYVEHPPLSIALLWLSNTAFGDSLFAVRFLPALAGAATVLVTGLIARELGGGARAQSLAALAALASPFYLGIAHFYSMNVFDVLIWSVLGLLAVRILQRDEARLWVVFGLVAGIGLMNKVSVGFLGFGLVVGLLATRERRWFASPWLWAGGVAALLVFAPHLIWQAQHGWPTLEFQANARASKNMPLSLLDFSVQQIQMGNPILLPLWLTGIGGLLFLKQFASVRPVAVAYPALFILFSLTTAKAYYLAPVYSIYFAAGAVVIEPILATQRWRTPTLMALIIAGSLPLVPLALPVLSETQLAEYSRTIGLEAPQLEVHEQSPLPQTFADMHGWQELVDVVAEVVSSLPEEERNRVVVFASNYGEAGAIDVLGADRNLPPVICGHNSYWDWRPEEIPDTVIALRRSREELERWFTSVEHVATVECEWCMPFQKEARVHVARDLKIPVDSFWSEIKRTL